MQDADSILKHIYGDPLDFKRSSADAMKIIDNLVAESNQPLLAEIAIKDRNDRHAGYITSQITDEKLLIDIAKKSLSTEARTEAIRKIRENPANEDDLIYIAKHDSFYSNRNAAIAYINDKSALNEMLNDSSILENLTEPNYSHSESYKKLFREAIQKRLEKIEE